MTGIVRRRPENATHWLVLPSPFLGAAAYAGLAAALTVSGDEATVATYGDPPVAARLVDAWVEQAARLDEVVLVPHSNAGLLAPLVSDRCGGLPIVFVDAALPAPSGPSSLVPAGLRSHLADLAGADGRLPPWTRWWPRHDLDEVLPGDWYDRIDAIAPRVPLAYADDVVYPPGGWEAGPCAYLAFGAETYADELLRVRRLGWPHRFAPGRHLDCVVAPDDTAAAVRALTRELCGSSSALSRRPGQPCS